MFEVDEEHLLLAARSNNLKPYQIILDPVKLKSAETISFFTKRTYSIRQICRELLSTEAYSNEIKIPRRQNNLYFHDDECLGTKRVLHLVDENSWRNLLYNGKIFPLD